MKQGFTLIEMLVVIGIIAVLTAACTVGYSGVIRNAENTRARELVNNVSTALTALYQREGAWPKKLLSAAGAADPMFREDAALAVAKKGYLTLDMDKGRTKLVGYDRYGVVTPWGVDIVKRAGKGELTAEQVKKIEKHTLRFAVDVEGLGFTEVPADVAGGKGTKVRATACVWCCNRDGSLKSKDIIKSWTDGQHVK